jgi:hypothetical protein
MHRCRVHAEVSDECYEVSMIGSRCFTLRGCRGRYIYNRMVMDWNSSGIYFLFFEKAYGFDLV